MKSLKKYIAAAAAVGIIVYTFNFDYFGYFLSLVCDSAIECVSGGNEASQKLEYELGNLSVSDFVKLNINGKDADLTDLDNISSDFVIEEMTEAPSGPSGIIPTGQIGGRPAGDYTKEDTASRKRQNESADLIAAMGYVIDMLPEIEGGNGYGIKAGTNPDFLIENLVFDCYAPSSGSIRTIVNEIADKTQKQAHNIVLNLDDYQADMTDLMDRIISKANPNGDLKNLNELFVIKNGTIQEYVFGGQ